MQRIAHVLMIVLAASFITAGFIRAEEATHAQGVVTTPSALLLDQQFKAGKTCKPSILGRRATDCVFKAGATEIRIVGATGITRAERIFGYQDTGFHIASMEPTIAIHVSADKDFGLLIKVSECTTTDEKPAIPNSAYITLDGDVLSPHEMEEVKYEASRGAMNSKEYVKYVQENLVLLGYKLDSPDGVMGPQTRTAIDAFKRDRKLKADVPDYQVFQKITEDAYLKILDELRRLTEGMGKPVT